jgi:hypothetical protein
MEPCAWQGQNGYIAYRVIKWSIWTIFYGRIYCPLGVLSLSLSLSLLYRHLTDLIVGGGFVGQPPAGLCCLVGQHVAERTTLMMPHHRGTFNINNWHRLWEMNPRPSIKTRTGRG